jgi:hypothetical protein
MGLPPSNAPPAAFTPQYMLAFVPSGALSPDSGYDVEVISDSEAVLGFTDATIADETASLGSQQTRVTQRIAVFSGSRPLPVELQVAVGKPIISVRLRFSEPVSIGSLVGNVVILGASGTPIPSCPWAPLMNACADATSQQVSYLFDFVFPSPVALSDLEGGSLSVSGTICGSSRTIAEAAGLVGRALDPTTGNLVLPLDATTRLTCGTRDDLLCFRDQTAR